MSETNSEKASIESAVASGIERLQQINKNHERVSRKAGMTKIIWAILKILVEKKVLEERALRNLRIEYSYRDDDEILGAHIPNPRLQDFLHSDYKEMLKKWSTDLKNFAIEQLSASGYEFNWLNLFDGVHFALRTLTPLDKALLITNEKDMHTCINALPEGIREVCIRLVELGFSQQSVRTIKTGELYEIFAHEILGHIENTFWILQVGIEVRKKH